MPLKKFGTDLIFITDWLTSKRPFYAYPTDDNPVLSNTFDLLCGGAKLLQAGSAAIPMLRWCKESNQKEWIPQTLQIT